MDLLKNLIWTDESKEVSTGNVAFNSVPVLAAGITCIAGPSVCGGTGGGDNGGDPGGSTAPIYAAGITCLAGPSIC